MTGTELLLWRRQLAGTGPAGPASAGLVSTVIGAHVPARRAARLTVAGVLRGEWAAPPGARPRPPARTAVNRSGSEKRSRVHPP
ncbi:hypothetical protein [Streptomyces sp. NPDC003273]|uniref:hypothetical protein n=1 Tax=Streptomyces sp. NPDC003273 TaxID=3364678 RepID=UPI0036BA84B0